MLGSLIKYEFKATYKMFFILYAFVMLLGCINRFLFNFQESVDVISDYTYSFSSQEIALITFIAIYVILVITVIVLTIYMIIKRFYSNLFGDEGYLMNTLPVMPWQNILSKFIVAVVWLFLGGIVCLTSVVILVTHEMDIQTFVEKLFEAFTSIDVKEWKIILNFFVSVITEQFANIMIIYCSISLGQLFNKHRKLAAFGSFVGITTCISVITSSLASFIFMENMDFIGKLNTGLVFGTITNLFILIIMFFITNYIVKNKLNLE